MTTIISRISDGRYEVKVDRSHMGEIIQEVDGFYVFYPVNDGGAWSEHLVSAIANKLKNLNLEIQAGIVDRLYKNGL